ncbi:hypothetical protein [Aliikangiella sp. IMCC44359]|uniref:hypothetical protein n=1 Tax=Aliikangiella sp. IMCC44359 TaxID=3459125 RepID=UPI00403A8157
MIKAILILLSLVHLPIYAKKCTSNKDVMGVGYTITTQSLESKKVLNKTSLNFWRFKDQVAYEYPDKQFFEAWNLVSNGQIRPTRYFDQYKKGIEYQPMDINHGKGERNWSSKNHIVSNAYRQKLISGRPKGTGCQKVTPYYSSTSKHDVVLQWLEAYQLPQQLKVVQKNTIITWHADKIMTNAAIVKQAFIDRDNYVLTDYVDIGDHESDPFLNKMINLGFISHHTKHESH